MGSAFLLSRPFFLTCACRADEQGASELRRALRCMALSVVSTKVAGALAARRELARWGMLAVVRRGRRPRVGAAGWT